MLVKLAFSAAVAGAALSAVAATTALTPLDNKSETQTVRDLTGPDPELLIEYQACSDLAEVHVLSPSRARQCADVYLALKLSFLPDVDIAAYWALPIEQRWVAQKSGYAAFRQWKEASMLFAQSD